MATTVGFFFAVLAGGAAAMASVFGKLAMNASYITEFFLASAGPKSGIIENESSSTHAPDAATLLMIVKVMQAVCFGMIILCNMAMWSLFVRALDRLPSSLIATAVNTASNFFLSALFGFLLFGEGLPLMWWMGASLILLGLLFMNQSKQQLDEEEKKEK